MIYKIYNPSPLLNRIIEHYWHLKNDNATPSVQYHQTPLLQGLAFNFYNQEEQHMYEGKTIGLYKKGYFYGQPTCARTITSLEKSVDIFGVKLKPLGMSAITGINMEHMADSCVAAEDIWKTEFEFLCDEMYSAKSIEDRIAVLERFLINRISRVKQKYYFTSMNYAISLIHRSNGGILVSEIQQQTNISRKTLERNFIQSLGVKPKLYIQIVRYNIAKARLDSLTTGKRIGDVAFDLGYFNNSHLAAEFRRFSGVSPRQYLQDKMR